MTSSWWPAATWLVCSWTVTTSCGSQERLRRNPCWRLQIISCSCWSASRWHCGQYYAPVLCMWWTRVTQGGSCCLLFSPFLYIGTTQAFFQSMGTFVHFTATFLHSRGGQMPQEGARVHHPVCASSSSTNTTLID